MVEGIGGGGGGGSLFPVMFFDGEREMNIGNVAVNSTMEYKPFQLRLSQMIGISPNQISIYLIDRRKGPKPLFGDDRKRIPITGKVNFGLISRQKDCSFLVVLKRSRKSRSRRERMFNPIEFSDYLPVVNEFSPPLMQSVPENMILLRRDQSIPFYDQITHTELADLNDRLQSLRFHRENYQMAMARGGVNNMPGYGSDYGLDYGSPYSDPYSDPFPLPGEIYRSPTPTSNETTSRKKLFCEDCVNGNGDGDTSSFHLCVNDKEITRFTTRAGPIKRPNEQLQ